MSETNHKTSLLQKNPLLSVNLFSEKESKETKAPTSSYPKIQIEHPAPEKPLKLSIKGIHQGPELPPIQHLTPQPHHSQRKKQDYFGSVPRRELGFDSFNDYIGPISPQVFDLELMSKKPMGVSIHSLRNRREKRKKPLAMLYEPSPEHRSQTRRTIPHSELEGDTGIVGKNPVGSFNLFEKGERTASQSPKAVKTEVSPEKKKVDKPPSPVKQPAGDKSSGSFQQLYQRILDQKSDRELTIRTQESNPSMLLTLKSKLKGLQTEGTASMENLTSLRANAVDVEMGTQGKVDLSLRTKFKSVQNQTKFMLVPVVRPLIKPQSKSNNVVHPIKRKIMKRPENQPTEIFRTRREDLNRTSRIPPQPRSEILYFARRKNSKTMSLEERMEEIIQWTSRKVSENRKAGRKIFFDPATFQEAQASILHASSFGKSVYRGEDGPEIPQSKHRATYETIRDIFEKSTLSYLKDTPTEIELPEKFYLLRKEDDDEYAQRNFKRATVSRNDHYGQQYGGPGEETEEETANRKQKIDFNPHEFYVSPKNLLEKQLKTQYGEDDSVEGWDPDGNNSEVL